MTTDHASPDENNLTIRYGKRWTDWIVYPGTFILLLTLAMNLNFPGGKNRGKSEFWSDQGGYYIYLPATFIYGYGTGKYPDSIDHKLRRGFGLDREKNTVVTKYTYGVSLFILPFFLPVHLITGATSSDADGFSMTYQRMAVAAGVFYLVLSLFILKAFLMHYFPRPLSYILPFLVFLSTNLYYYAMDEVMMSHLYSFFLVALLLFLLKKYLGSGMRSLKLFTVISFVLAFLILIRPTHLFLVSLLIFWDTGSRKEVIARLKHFAKPVYPVLFLLALLIVFFPQMYYWHFISGNWIHYSYAGEGFSNWDHPMIIPFWFSQLNGLFIYSPFAVLFVAGFLWMIMRKRPNGIYITALFLFYSYLFSSWCMWFFGGSFGSRPMTDLYPVFLLPAGYVIHGIMNQGKLIYKGLFLLLLLAFPFYTLRLIYYNRWNTSGIWAWDDFRDHLRYAGLIHFNKTRYRYIDDCENGGGKKYFRTGSEYRSGIRSGEIFAAGDTVMLFNRHLGRILDKPAEQVNAVLWTRNPAGQETGAEWVCLITEGKNEFFRRSVSLDSAVIRENGWECAVMNFPVPHSMNRWGVITFYIVNRQDSHFYFDDLSITFK